MWIRSGCLNDGEVEYPPAFIAWIFICFMLTDMGKEFIPVVAEDGTQVTGYIHAFTKIPEPTQVDVGVMHTELGILICNISTTVTSVLVDKWMFPP